MLHDLGWLKTVKVKDSSGTVINPSTDEKLEELKTLLQDIENNTDELELKAENINLNTDTLEAKVQSVTEAIGQESATTVLTRLKDIWDKLVSLFNDGVAKSKLWDGTNTAEITTSGRLKIDTSPPDAPADTTEVTRTEYSSVSGSDDDVYIIPTGETLIIQRFVGGAETDTTAGNVVELWYDPLGTGVGMTIIDMIFCSGSGDQHDLRATSIGDGTKAIRMRRRRFSGGSKEIFGRWEGYY